MLEKLLPMRLKFLNDIHYMLANSAIVLLVTISHPFAWASHRFAVDRVPGQGSKVDNPKSFAALAVRLFTNEGYIPHE